MTTPGGYWRDGDVLVMHKRATLPDRCVLTGEPAGLRLTHTFVWTPRWVALTSLLAIVGIGLPIFLALSALKNERATIALPVSTAALENRNKQVKLAWVGTAMSLLVGVLGFLRGVRPHHALWLIPCFVGLGVFCAAYARTRRLASLLTLEGMGPNTVRFGGVHCDVLAEMPTWLPDSPDHPRWEWIMPNGECVVASYDPVNHTETVWLGSSLVSRAISGEKPDGHLVALTQGIAFRGAGVAEVRFAPAIQSCSLELDGQPVATSLLTIDPKTRAPEESTPRDAMLATVLRIGIPVVFGLAAFVTTVFIYAQTAPRTRGGGSATLADGGALTAAASSTDTTDAGAFGVDDASTGFVPPPTPTIATPLIPFGRHACIDNAYVCSEDGKELLQCKNGRLLVTYRVCRGPTGCKMLDPTTPDCDQSIAEAGDACWLQGKLACSADGTALFSCVAGSYIRSRVCATTPCSLDVPGRVQCDSR